MDIESIIRQNCNEKVEDGLNQLLNLENQCWYMLKAMSVYFDSSTIARPGLAKFFLKTSMGAKKHYNAVLKHIKVRGLTVIFEDITKPSVPTWGSPLAAMVTCLEMCKNVVDNWYQLHTLTVKYEDPCTEMLVKKIICDLVTLISIVGSHVNNLKRIGDDPTGLYIYGQEAFKVELIPNVDIDETDFDTILQ
jgi:ferritin